MHKPSKTQLKGQKVALIVFSTVVASASAMAAFAQTFERSASLNALGHPVRSGARNLKAMPVAAPRAALPASYQDMAATLASRLTPAGVAWVSSNAAAFRNGAVSETQIRSDADQNATTLMATLGEGKSGDIESLCFLVMMAAQQSADQDLRDTMASVRDNNQRRRELRDITATAAPASNQMRSDASQEMSEIQSLRMQMAMDRLSKMMTTLSSILKKMSDSQSGITNNIK